MKNVAEKARNTKSTRIWFMVLLLAVIFLLYVTGVIKKGFAIGLGIVLLAAIGIETFNYDLDLGKLWETGNIQESRVTHTKDGLKLMGSCALPIKWEGDLNCSNFKTQGEAQAKYDQCASEIASYNQGVDAAKVKSLDIYGLDKNKNGIVCEALPGAPKESTQTETATPQTQTKTSTKTPTTTSTSTKTSGDYSTTPIPRVTEPYVATPASDRSTPKSLPQ
mgnify:CR=1 FL=1